MRAEYMRTSTLKFAILKNFLPATIPKFDFVRIFFIQNPISNLQQLMTIPCGKLT